MAASQRAGNLNSATRTKPRGRPRNDGCPAGSVAQEVFIDLSTNAIIPRPRGRPSNEFLRQTRKLLVPPGHNPEKYAHDLLASEKVLGDGRTYSDPSRTEEQPHQSRPASGKSSIEQAMSKEPDISVDENVRRPGSADEAMQAVASVKPVAIRNSGSSETHAHTSHANQNAEDEPIEEQDKVLQYLRARVLDLETQRDTWWEIYQQEQALHQQELDHLKANFDRLFATAANDIQALHSEMALSFQGVN
jgi:hypothetical protein